MQRSDFETQIRDFTTIEFYVNGDFVGEFNYHVWGDIRTLTCANDAGVECMKITLGSDFVYLDDYFYGASLYHFQCDMKPKTTRQHSNILNTLLEYLASKTGVPQIKLQDASYLPTVACPNVDATIFKLAGYPTFYERYGFSNDAYDDAFNELKAEEIVDPMLADARAIGFTGNTVHHLAKFIVDSCKGRKLRKNEPLRRSVEDLILSLSEMVAAAEGYVLVYYKPAIHEFES